MDDLQEKIYFYKIKTRKELAKKRNLDYVGEFSSEGIARVKKNNEYFYIDIDGQKITSEKFDETHNFYEG